MTADEPPGPEAGAAPRPAAEGAPDDPPSRRERRSAQAHAAHLFLIGEWVGAVLLLASFTQFYWVVVAPVGGGWIALVLGLGLAAIGGFVYLRSRRYREAFGATGGRSHAIATVVAGAGAMFWLLFALLMLLHATGVPILPD